MLNKILEEVKQFKQSIAELKSKSKYYPEILIVYEKEYDRKTCYASTLVRIERDNIWYTVHCVESIILEETFDEKNLLLKMMFSVHQIQNLYRITGEFEEKDTLQISEIERVSKLNY